MSDKSIVLKAFNNHFFDFFNEIMTIFPENVDIKSSIDLFHLTKKANPTLLVKIWYQFVEQPYGELIQKDDLDYFINKDYKEDVVQMPYSENVLQGIDSIRKPIKEMSDHNKKQSVEYIKNLCKLSAAYTK